MMHLDNLQIDPVELGGQGTAVLGIRASGKSYLGTLLGERLMDAGVPIIAFDPIGVWRYLRVPGATGKGYPVVVAGGEHGDLPLTPEGAPEIVRAAMRDGISLIIDLYSMKLSKADWRRIVEQCVRVLLYENKGHGLRHVFIEEAAEFAPQIVSRDYGHVYAEIEKLARMGGNAMLGYTLISQRSEQVNKAVLELCDNLFLFRQKGRLSLTALSKWLDIGSAKGGSEIIDSLPTLGQGVCWAWLAGSSTPVKINVPTKRSFHPDRSKMHGDVDEIINRSAVDVGTFVNTMKTSLEKIVEEAQANDPKRLKARIAELEREKAKPVPAVVDDELIAAAWTEGYTQGADEGFKSGMDAGISAERQRLGQKVLNFAADFALATGEAHDLPVSAPRPVSTTSPKVRMSAPAPQKVANGGAAPKIVANGVDMGAERKPLAILARVYPGGYTEAQWAALAGFKRTGGTWGTYKSRLRSAGRIEQRGDLWYATETGAADVGETDPMPEAGIELVEFWAGRIGAENKFLRYLAEQYPSGITKAELAERFDMAASGGTFGTYLSRLRSNGLIEEGARGLRVSPNLMGFDA